MNSKKYNSIKVTAIKIFKKMKRKEKQRHRPESQTGK